MDLSGIPHPRINWDSTNLPDEWDKFQHHVELIFSGPLKAKSEEEQVSYLLLWIGEQGRQIYKTWTGISDGDAKKLKTYYDRFKSHVQPKLNPIFARFRFNNEVQGTDNIDSFITRLRIRARDCKFQINDTTNITDDMIRDRIVFGCTSPKVREKLINAGDKLTLDKAIQTVQNFEYCQKQLSSMAVGDSNAVDAVKQTSSRSRRQTKRSTGHTDRYRTEDARVRTDKPNKCGNCGTVHDKFRCPATGKRCRKCNKMNHFQVMCRSRSSKYVHDVVEKDSDSDQDTYAYNIDMVSDSISSSHSKNRDPLFVTLHVGPKKSKIKFKIDTGSSVNIIPISIFRSIGLKHPMQAPDCKLIAYSGNMLNTLGVVNLDCCHRTVVRPTKFYIVDTNAPPLIGTQSSLDLGLIKLTYAVDAPSSEEAVFTKETVMKVYGDVFKGVGVLPGKCHLHLKEGAIPTVNPPRRIPETLKSKLKKELDQMVKDKIIRRVTEPTDWVNSIVVVEKPNTGKLRICLDPKALNEAIRRPHFKTPTLEDVTAQLAGAKYFSILDITHAYWSVELDDESSLLTMFHSPIGERYCYLRLPFGISSAGDIFQRKVTEIFEGLPGIQAIVDDTLIYGKTREEHDPKL